MKKIIKAPAKINLFLSVDDLRKDNYHNLTMIMQCVSLFDTLEVEVLKDNKKEIIIYIDKTYIPVDRRNLIYQVVEYMQENYNISDSFIINLKKLIPTSGGLGGGSSDAASMLHFINNTYKLKNSLFELARIGSLFGSDIPFFVYRHESICKGRGEIITPIKKFNNYFVLLATPNTRVSTKDIFSKYDSINNKNCDDDNKMKKFNRLMYAIEKGDVKDLSYNLYNDLEKVTEPIVSDVALFKKRLIELGAKCSLMSGSGPTVYGIFTSIVKAFNCKNILKKEHDDAFVFVARPI